MGKSCYFDPVIRVWSAKRGKLWSLLSAEVRAEIGKRYFCRNMKISVYIGKLLCHKQKMLTIKILLFFQWANPPSFTSLLYHFFLKKSHSNFQKNKPSFIWLLLSLFTFWVKFNTFLFIVKVCLYIHFVHFICCCSNFITVVMHWQWQVTNETH